MVTKKAKSARAKFAKQAPATAQLLLGSRPVRLAAWQVH